MKEGDKLVCVNDKPLDGNDIGPPLKSGNKYTLNKITKCKCNKEHFDVGLKSEQNYVRCYDCEQELEDGNKIHWCHPSRFELIN